MYLIVGLLWGLLFGIAWGIALGIDQGISWGLFTGAFIGLLFGLRFGGLTCVQHVILRILLYLNGLIPWNVTRFLDHCAERIFLRKVGGGYIFVHRLLMEHFASLYERENTATSTEPTA
jgi:hypothetical protein